MSAKVNFKSMITSNILRNSMNKSDNNNAPINTPEPIRRREALIAHIREHDEVHEYNVGTSADGVVVMSREEFLAELEYGLEVMRVLYAPEEDEDVDPFVNENEGGQ